MDTSELPIAFLYFVYLFLYFWYVKKFKEPGIFNGYILPLMAAAGSIFIIYAALKKEMIIEFSVVIAIIMIIGNLLNKKRIVKNL